MPLLDITLDGQINKVDVAIQRIRTFEPIRNGFFDSPYYVAYSGGKDSDAIRILCELAGVRYDLVHNHTTVDAPETVRYVRSIPGIQINKPIMSMWNLIVAKGIPPTRLARYCCEALKEHGGNDRFVMTGVRWAESVKRRKLRGGVEVLGKKATKLILNADNDDSRRLLEQCRMKGKRILNPIVDWSDADVWELLEYYRCSSNPLYQEGFKRVGCVGCPNAGCTGMKRDFIRWPKYKTVYIRAFQRMVDAHHYAEESRSWKDGESVFRWWLNDKNHVKPIEGQELIEGW